MQNFLALLVVVLMISCTNKGSNLVKESDYNLYLRNDHYINAEVSISTELEFWGDKLLKNKDVIAQVKFATGLLKKFSITGNVNDLEEAERLYRNAHSLLRTNSSDGYRYLAYTALTKHEFGKALSFLDSALAMGDNKYQTLLLIFDAALESGDNQK